MAAQPTSGHRATRTQRRGVREYSILRIAVYAAALYVATKQTAPDVILDSPTIKLMQLRMLRNVSRDDSVRAWDHYLTANCNRPCVIDDAARVAFLALIPDSRAGDTQTYTFARAGLSIEQNGTMRGRVDNPGFARLVLATWIGAVPSTETLKRALLRGQ